MTRVHVHNCVKEYRTGKEITQQQLAEAIGVSRQTVVAIEGGNYTPSVLLAIRIAQELDESVETLFSLNEQP